MIDLPFYLPGTTVEIRTGVGAREFLGMAFATGGLVLSQVAQLTGLTMHTIQNWVKRKFVASPVQKKYDINSFCTIAIINMLKDVFQIEKIVNMLENLKNIYGENAPKLVYTSFAEMLFQMPESAVNAIEEATKIEELTIRFAAKSIENNSEAQKKLQKILKIMLLAQFSSNIKKEAEILLEEEILG